MPNCLYCYEPLKEGEIDYHPACAERFFGHKEPPELPYQLSEMEVLAKEAAEQSVTVPGVQPKLSLNWIRDELDNRHSGRLTIMDALQGNFILKPPNSEYPQMPENEHLSMKLAELFKINTVPSSLIRLASGELCYITKRIDRGPDNTKSHMIDFLQILELSDKYKGTMERLGKKIGDLSENKLLDKLRFFEVTVFNYLIGNNDMHLKNFSMFLSPMGWVLAPFYDLLNVKLILPKDEDDTALLLGGKKKEFNKGYFDELASNLELNEKQRRAVYRRIHTWLPQAKELIGPSFLTGEMKEEYARFISERAKLFEAGQ
jgi:serine/threonine-protein kinase HipA